MKTTIDEGSRTAIKRFLGLVALAAVFAAVAAPQAALPVLAGLTVTAGLVSIAVALLAGEPFAAGMLNHWDQALALLGVSMLAHLLADPEAAQSLSRSIAGPKALLEAP